MLDGLLNRSNFRTKCKSAISRTKTRLEVIKKKRNAVQKFLKKDIADLLKNNLDRNAYGRTEGLYTELNLSSCYDYVAKCCTCISEHLKEMHKERECPEECKVAVSSLVYAAARFSDLPELRDLRNHFTEKYGKSLESFVSEELVEKLKSKPPTMEMKIQLMLEIAQELSVTWDSLPFQQQLRTQEIDKPVASRGGAGDKMFKSMSTAAQVKSKQDDNMSNKPVNVVKTDNIRTRRHNSYSQFTDDVSEKLLEKEEKTKPSLKSDAGKSPYRDEEKAIASKNQQENNQNPRYTDDYLFSKTKPRPQSVRTKFLNSSGSSATSSSENNEIDNVAEIESTSARAPQSIKHEKADNNNIDTPKSAVLPLPPGRRRYLFADQSQGDSPRRESDGQTGLGRSIFHPPDSPKWQSEV